MKSEEEIKLADLIEGKIDDATASSLLDDLSRDTALAAQLDQQLHYANLISRELDPKRGDAAFLAGLDATLDGLDGLDGDGDPSGDGSPSDGGGVDPSGLESGLSLPDPATATAGTAGGIALGPVIGVIIAAVVAGTAIVYRSVDRAAPPVKHETVDPSLPTVVEAASPSVPSVEFVDVPAERDLFIVRNTTNGKPQDAEVAEILELRQDNVWAGTYEIYLHFDLSALEGEIESANLRLYCVETPSATQIQPVAAHLIDQPWAGAEGGTDGRLHTGKGVKMGTWTPRGNQFSSLEIAGYLKPERMKDGKVKLWVKADVPRDRKMETRPTTKFASSEHPNEAWRPTLRVQLKK